jgi:holo-[acyl-carrier protein] synthase
MIYGIGTDIVEVSRIEDSLARFGDAFAQRILNEREWLVYAQSQTAHLSVSDEKALAAAFVVLEKA